MMEALYFAEAIFWFGVVCALVGGIVATGL